MLGDEPVENLVTWVYGEGSYVPVAKIQDGERYTINNPTLYGYVGDCNKYVDLFGLLELGDLVKEAHSLLDPIAQKHKTTAVGLGRDGKMYIASSDEIVPRVQHEWAKSKGVEPIRGIGHAEEILMNANKGITHIDASRKVCLDCEGMMKQCHVTTDTEKSGKRSKNRLSGCNK